MKRSIVLAVLIPVLFTGCRPSSSFKVTLKVIDDATGKPIPDALVFVGAHVSVAPPLRPPYDKAIAAARGLTDARGAVRISKVKGMYVGETPQDPLWLMLESRYPKEDYKVTGVQGGSILVFAPGYGVLEQPFYIKEKGGLDDVGRLPGYGWLVSPGSAGYREPRVLDPGMLAKGGELTLRVAKAKDFDQAYKRLGFPGIMATLDLSSWKTGTTPAEKDLIWAFFKDQMEYAASVSTDPYYRRQLDEFNDPKIKAEFGGLRTANADPDARLYEWMTEKALERLPAGMEEVKQYSNAIQKGVAEEWGELPSRNHFYNPALPEQGFPNGQSAVKWGAIGYPDNPGNAWDWEDAQRYYRGGDKAKAYEALGHVLRLLEDLAMPRFSSLDPGKDRGFEDFLAGQMAANAGSLPQEFWQKAAGPEPAYKLRERFDDVVNRTLRLTQTRPAVTQDRTATRSYWESVAKQSLPQVVAQDSELMQYFFRNLHHPATAQAPGDGDGAEHARSVTESTAPSTGSNPKTQDPQVRIRILTVGGKHQASGVDFLNEAGHVTKHLDLQVGDDTNQAMNALVSPAGKVVVVSKWRRDPDQRNPYLLRRSSSTEITWYDDHGAKMGSYALPGASTIVAISENGSATIALEAGFDPELFGEGEFVDVPGLQDAADLEKDHELIDHYIYAFKPNGNLLFSKRIPGPGVAPHHANVSPSGEWLVYALEDYSAYLTNIITGRSEKFFWTIPVNWQVTDRGDLYAWRLEKDETRIKRRDGRLIAIGGKRTFRKYVRKLGSKEAEVTSETKVK